MLSTAALTLTVVLQVPPRPFSHCKDRVCARWHKDHAWRCSVKTNKSIWFESDLSKKYSKKYLRADLYQNSKINVPIEKSE